MRKEELKRDIPLYFSNHILRVITWATRSYAEVLKRLNSCYSYSSEAYYQSQLDKLSEVLESEKTIKNSNVTSVEIRYLSEGEIPFFYTYGDRRDIFADGSVVAADYYIQSAVERVESFHPVVLTLDVCLHEADIRCEVFEQRSGVSPTENGDAHIGVLHGKRVDHGYNHGHVAQGGKAYDEDVLTFHLFLL